MPEPSATPPPESNAAAAATSAPMIKAPLSCVRCDYDLRGLPIEGRCPECGVPVEVSQRERRRLADAAVPYVNTLYAGAWLVVIALVLRAISIIGGCTGGWFLTAFSPTASVRPFDVAFLTLDLLQASAWALGWWWICARSLDWAPRAQDDSERVMLRILTVTAAVSYAALQVMDAVSTGGIPLPGAARFAPVGRAWTGSMVVAGLTAFVTGLIHCVIAMSYTRRLALRADDPEFAATARQAKLLVPVFCTFGACIIIGPLIGFILYWSVVERLRAHLSAIRVARAAEFGD